MRKLTPRQVVEVRERYWCDGESSTSIAATLGVTQPTVHRAAVGRMYASFEFPACSIYARTLAIADPIGWRRYRQGAPPPEQPEPEQQEAVDTGTGRIVGPDGTVYQDIRRAEVATGEDRQAIAESLNSGTGHWRYEPGPAKAEAPVILGDVLVFDGRGIHVRRTA
jgi:hypothetical protein